MRNPHSLALLFIVFATAAILDQGKQPYSIEAQEYYYLSRAALGLASPVRETTLAAIQALVRSTSPLRLRLLMCAQIHMAQYLDLNDWEGTGSNAAWMYVGTAVRLAHGVSANISRTPFGLLTVSLDWPS